MDVAWVVITVAVAAGLAAGARLPVRRRAPAGSVIAVLGDPVGPGAGGLEPVEMERMLRILDRERRPVGDRAPVGCVARGAAV